MRRLALFLIIAAVLAAPLFGKGKKKNDKILPALVVNARYVYVTSYEGEEISPQATPDDRNAVVAVRDAIESWGRYKIAYDPQDADLILLVRSGRVGTLRGEEPSIHAGSDGNRGGAIPGQTPPGEIPQASQPFPGPQQPTAQRDDPASIGPTIELGHSDDELAVYDARTGLHTSPLWRGLLSDGLTGKDPELVKKFRKAVEDAAKRQQQPKNP